jgi:protein transport protein SEC13
MIHDAQLDYYGKRLATCSSDRTVKVFDVVDGEAQRTGGHTLKGYAVAFSSTNASFTLTLDAI